MAIEKQKLSTVLWSAGGLLATLFIAWYFSRNKNGASTSTNDNAQSPAYTINVPGITVPSIPTPVIPTAPTSNQNNACCKRCADSSGVSAGKVLQSGSFTQATFEATHAVATTQTVNPTTQDSSVPIGPQLIPQSNGGMPLPSLSWWQNDLLYRQAYVIAYNETLGRLMQILMQQNRNGFSAHSSGVRGCGPIHQLPMTWAENDSPDKIINQVTFDGENQAGCAGTNTRVMNQAQSNSMLMMQTMQISLNQWLSKLGDKNSAGGGIVLPPDQQIFTIQ